MSSPISAYLRQNQTDAVARKAADQTKVEPGTGDAKSVDKTNAASKVSANLGDDVLQLSDVAQKAMDAPSFDRTRVDAIKQSIAENGYPVDPRRIAEQFVAIEKMIQD